MATFLDFDWFNQQGIFHCSFRIYCYTKARANFVEKFAMPCGFLLMDDKKMLTNAAVELLPSTLPLNKVLRYYPYLLRGNNHEMDWAESNVHCVFQPIN